MEKEVMKKKELSKAKFIAEQNEKKKAMEKEVMKKKELSKDKFIEEQNEKKKEVEKEVRVDEWRST